MSLICRTCLHTKINLVNVFSHYENNKLVSEMLSECTSVETRKSDGLPLQICGECLEKLISAWCFRIMTIEADLKLRKTFCKYEADNQFQNEDLNTIVVKEEIIVKDELPDPLIVEKSESLHTSITNFNNVVQNHTEKMNTSNIYISECSNKKNMPPVTCSNHVSYLNIENRVLKQFQQDLSLANVTEQNYILKSNQNTASLVVNNENINKSLWEYQCNSIDNFTDIVQNELLDPLIEEKNECLNTSVTNFNNIVKNHTVSSEKINTSDLYISDCSNNKKSPPVISQVFHSTNENSVLQNAQQHVNQNNVTEQNYLLNSNQNTVTSVVNNENMDKSLWRYQHGSFVNFTDIAQNELTTDVQLNEENYQGSAHCNKKENISLAASNDQCIIIPEPLEASNHIGGNLPFKCNICGKAFPQLSRLKIHEIVHSDVRPFTCDVCGKSFKMFNTFQRHKTVHVSNKPHKCNICHLSFKLKSNLGVHMKRHKNQKDYICKICGKAFFRDSELRSHMKSHLNIKDFLCSFCGKAFATNSKLLTHFRCIHTNERPYSCNHCDRRFKEKRVLEKHVLIHTGEKPYTCKLCSKSFRQAVALRTHMRTHTGETPFVGKLRPLQIKQTAHKCNICNLSFELKSLEVHMKRHKNQKDYMCETCGKTFVEDGELRSHMKSHLDIKDFLCSLCGKAFRSNSNLQDHFKRIHTNERPYVCNHCDRRFKDKRVMERHALIHTGEKPHTCELCSKSFRQAVGLRTHMRTHTGETPFVCKLCPLQFKYKRLLSNHMKVHK